MARNRNQSYYSKKSSSPTLRLVLYGLILLSLAVAIVLSRRVAPLLRRDDRGVNGVSSRGDENEEDTKDRWVEVISWEPRAFIYHNFLAKHESEHLIRVAKPHMKKLTIVDNETGKRKKSRLRTGSGTYLGRGGDEIVRRIEKRIADLTFIPASLMMTIYRAWRRASRPTLRGRAEA